MVSNAALYIVLAILLLLLILTVSGLFTLFHELRACRQAREAQQRLLLEVQKENTGLQIQLEGAHRALRQASVRPRSPWGSK
jgi:hypothetical protein